MIDDKFSTGAEKIAEERLRQIEEEGFDGEHDENHRNDELLRAAIAYLADVADEMDPDDWWPWPESSHGPKKGEIDSLVKAGAMVAAEIDRKYGDFDNG